MCDESKNIDQPNEGAISFSQGVLAQIARRGYLDVSGSANKRNKSAGDFVSGSSDLNSEGDAVKDGIKRLQRRYGLPASGKIDIALLEFLDMPYCDVPDAGGPSAMLSGGVPWKYPKVTYQFMKWPPGFSEGEIRAAFCLACQTWEAVCSVNFHEVQERGDMRVVFGSGNHGDGWPFDGTGRILAHAFYPDWPSHLAGDVHIDTSENWTIDPDAEIPMYDLVTTCIHEVGHAIGLPHSNVPGSVMWPNYVGSCRELHASDIAIVKKMYP